MHNLKKNKYKNPRAYDWMHAYISDYEDSFSQWNNTGDLIDGIDYTETDDGTCKLGINKWNLKRENFFDD